MAVGIHENTEVRRVSIWRVRQNCSQFENQSNSELLAVRHLDIPPGRRKPGKAVRAEPRFFLFLNSNLDDSVCQRPYLAGLIKLKINKQ